MLSIHAEVSIDVEEAEAPLLFGVGTDTTPQPAPGGIEQQCREGSGAERVPLLEVQHARAGEAEPPAGEGEPAPAGPSAEKEVPANSPTRSAEVSNV